MTAIEGGVILPERLIHPSALANQVGEDLRSFENFALFLADIQRHSEPIELPGLNLPFQTVFPIENPHPLASAFVPEYQLPAAIILGQINLNPRLSRDEGNASRPKVIKGMCGVIDVTYKSAKIIQWRRPSTPPSSPTTSIFVNSGLNGDSRRITYNPTSDQLSISWFELDLNTIQESRANGNLIRATFQTSIEEEAETDNGALIAKFIVGLNSWRKLAVNRWETGRQINLLGRLLQPASAALVIAEGPIDQCRILQRAMAETLNPELLALPPR